MSRTSEIELQSQPTESQERIIEPSSQPVQDTSFPDGGYGWVICACCATLAFWFVGTSYSWGIIQAALVLDGVADSATLSFVGAITTSCLALFAIVNGKIIRTIGARWSGLIGISLLGTGAISSGFSTHKLGGLFATVGVVMGLGCSLLFMTISVLPSQYFLRKRGLVNGLVYAGGGLGGTVISLMMQKLIDSVGTAWTFRIIGILTLATGLPAAYFIKERVPGTRRNYVEWRLFQSLRFDLLFVTGMIATFPLFVPPFFLPLFARSIGLSATTGAGLVAAFNFSSAIGRIGFGFFGDVLGPLNSLFFSLFLSALSMLAIWPVSSSLAPLVVFVIVNGAANGGFFAVVPTVVGSMFGSTRVTVVMGMVVSSWLGGYLMGGPIAGYLLQRYGGELGGISAYRPAMYYAGSMSMGAAILAGAMRLRVSKNLRARI